MEAMKVYRRGLERSALVMRGSRTVAEVFTDREPGDQYETAALFAAAPALLGALRASLPALIRLGDFVGNEDAGGPSGQGRIDRCALVLQVRDAISRVEGVV